MPKPDYTAFKLVLKTSLDEAVANASLSCYRPCDHKEIRELQKEFNRADNADNITLMEQVLNRILEFTQ